MNERIKELWDTAAKLESDPSWEGQTRFMEKFAELLIQEVIYDCMNTVRGENVLRVSMVAKHWGVEV